MESKLIIGFVIVLVLGFGGGFLMFDNSAELVQAQNELTYNQETYLELESTYNKLEAQHNYLLEEYESLEAEYDSIFNQYSDLSSENVERTAYDDLNDQYSATLEEINNLEVELSLLQTQYDVLNTEYQELTIDYEELLTEYQFVNGPSSSFTTINDLEIELTIDKTVYSYTESISGTVSIYYKNGEPFKGKVSFSVTTLGKGTLTLGYKPFVNGSVHYTTDTGVFHWGPGDCTIKISNVYDEDGYVIAGGNDLDFTTLNLEAK